VIKITKKRAKVAQVWLAVAAAAVSLLLELSQLEQAVIGILSHH
jgi:hypothetical protein